MTGNTVRLRLSIRDLTDELCGDNNPDDEIILKDGSSPNRKEPVQLTPRATARHPEFKTIVTSGVARNHSFNMILETCRAANKEFPTPKTEAQDEHEVSSLVDWATRKQIRNEPEPGPERKQITEEQIQAYRDEHIRSFPELPDLPAGFFADYMDFGTRMSYAYPAFHLGTSLALISLVAGRKVCMTSTGAIIYPNVFVACIGPTSTSGKSTACDMMFDQFFGLIREEGKLEELTKKTSPAGLLERLAAVPTRLWYYDECSEFFADIASRWAEALESIMCSVYDGRSVSYGLSKGKGKVDEYRANNVFLSCLWNTTNSEMERRAQWSHVTNGFLPRFMWFWSYENSPRANRDITEEDKEKREVLFKQIQRLRAALSKTFGDGRIVFKTHDAIEKWKLNDDLKHLDKDQELHRIATARLMPQAYKIAMLFSLMDEAAITAIENNVTFPLSLNIPDEYAELAITICENYLRPRLEYLMDLSKNNDTKNFQVQVIRCLQNHDGIAKRSLVMHETHINKRNFEETIESLEESETVEVLQGEPTGGRRGEILKLLR
jgi:hypothetical protein